MSKGSARRPSAVPRAERDARWERTFQTQVERTPQPEPVCDCGMFGPAHYDDCALARCLADEFFESGVESRIGVEANRERYVEYCVALTFSLGE